MELHCRSAAKTHGGVALCQQSEEEGEKSEQGEAAEQRKMETDEACV